MLLAHALEGGRLVRVRVRARARVRVGIGLGLVLGLLGFVLEGGRLVRRVRARVGIGLGLVLGLGFELEGVCLRRRDEVVQLHLGEG